jgi:hypothetical protein
VRGHQASDILPIKRSRCRHSATHHH